MDKRRNRNNEKKRLTLYRPAATPFGNKNKNKKTKKHLEDLSSIVTI